MAARALTALALVASLSLGLSQAEDSHLELLRQWEAEHAAPAPAAPVRSAASTSFALNFSHAYDDSMILQRAPHPASIWCVRGVPS